MANRNFPSQKMFTGHIMPVLLDCNFIVDSTNGNGLGIRSLKGPFVQNAFMHTTQTPGAGNSNPATPGIVVTNPNPQAGIIVIQLQDNYNRLLGGSWSGVTPLGTSVSVNGSNLTAGHPYVVTDVTSTPVASAADWAALGVPAGLISAVSPYVTVGTAFIAAATGHGTSASRVAPPAANGIGIDSIETIGDSNQAIAPNLLLAQGFGAQMLFQCMNSSGNHNVLAAPADGSVISLQFLLSNSSVLVQGE